MKVFMFISGRSYGNNLKYKAFYVCMSFMLMALFSTIFTVKPAFATDSNPDDKNPHGIFSGSVKCPGAYIPKQDKEEKDSGWWGCGYRSGLYGPLEFAKGIDPVITCHSGRKAEFKTKTENITYKLGHCVEGTSSTNKSVVEKNAVALADKAGPQDKLVNLIVSKIETSPWYLGLSDADKIAAGCKYQSLPGAPSGASEKGWFCDDAAKKKLAKMLIGTCIASAIRTVAKRPDGQDKSNEQIDKLFTDCIAKNSGLDKDTVNNNKAPIAWDDIKKDVDTSGSAATEESKADEAKNSCGLGGVGWAICPAMGFMGDIADQAYNTISIFLDISPKIFSDDSSTGSAKQAWSFFRDIANVIFVLLFLWVIFSQVSGIGISNYGIKKILPKLIVGAILINLSFYLCQLAIDLSNILGYSLKEIIESTASQIGGGTVKWGTAVLSILTSAGTIIFALLAVGGPLLISTLLVLLATLATLIVRQAVIILLVAISPVAFAAWLLPNTEGLFKKWASTFRGLLVIFPVISLLYGAGKLAGAILANTSESLMQIAAIAAPILPLGATPFVLKSSLNSLGSIGAKIGGLNSAAAGRFKNSALNDSRFSEAKNRLKTKAAIMKANSRAGNGIIGRTSQRLRNSNNKAARAAGHLLNVRRAIAGGGAEAQQQAKELFEKSVKNEQAAMESSGLTGTDYANIAITGKDKNGKVSEAKRAAAVDQVMANGSFEDRRKVLQNISDASTIIRTRAVNGSMAKGDGAIFGSKFGNEVLQGNVKSEKDLISLAIENAKEGNVSAQDLVKNGAGTAWLGDVVQKGYKAGDADATAAKANLIQSVLEAESNKNTSKLITGKMRGTFADLKTW
jgi:hypothetical protein